MKEFSFSRLILFIVIGALPGLIWWIGFGVWQGIYVAILFGLLGGLFSLPGISYGRVSRLFVSSIVTKNVPGAGDAMNEWVAKAGPKDGPGFDLNKVIFNWLFPKPGDARRGWILIVFMLIGAATSGIVVAHDLDQLSNQKDGWLLPFRGSKDSVNVQAGLFVAFSTILCALPGSLFASKYYRRPILSAAAFAFSIVFPISQLIITKPGSSPWVIVVVAVGAASLIAMLFAFFIKFEDEDDELTDIDPSNPYDNQGAGHKSIKDQPIDDWQLTDASIAKQYFQAIVQYDSMVNEFGHEYFFANNSDEQIELVANGLKAIQATNYVPIFSDALDLFVSAQTKTENELATAWGKIDQRYFDCDNQIEELLESYYRENEG